MQVVVNSMISKGKHGKLMAEQPRPDVISEICDITRAQYSLETKLDGRP